MKLVAFKEQTVVYAKDQPAYQPLPAYAVKNDPHGQIVCCWRLSLRERFQLLFTGLIWHSILTFNGPLQPQRLDLTKPDMPT